MCTCFRYLNETELKLFNSYSWPGNREKAKEPDLVAGGAGISQRHGVAGAGWAGKGGGIASASGSWERESSCTDRSPEGLSPVSREGNGFFQGSRRYNASLCFELIPEGVVGSSYSEIGGFAWCYSKEATFLFWSASETPSFTSDRSPIALVL